MKFEKTQVFNLENAIRGMRNPLQSWQKSDSYFDTGEFLIGYNDLALAQRLIKAGSEHRKFLRQIFVTVDITAPAYWWAEFDTYKIGVTRNSTSFQHKGVSKEFSLEDFGIDEDVDALVKNTLIEVVDTLNLLREKYKETKNYGYFRQIRQLLPQSYNYTSTVTMNYENILNMINQRKNHKLKEWNTDFLQWAEDLPYGFEFFIVPKEENKGE